MDYQAFKEYQQTLPVDVLRLDDLDIFPLRKKIQSDDILPQVLVPGTGYTQKMYKGVREALSDVFDLFQEQGFQLLLPEDIYPEYYNLASGSVIPATYSSFERGIFDWPNESRIVALIANPLIPEGKYLTYEQLAYIDSWLSQDEYRWVIFDNVYDFDFKALHYPFSSQHVMHVGSLSKIQLKPKRMGWAICNSKIFDFKNSIELSCDASTTEALKENFRWEWFHIREQLPQEINFSAPEVGYLTTVALDYRELLDKHLVAAIPASVFGIKKKGISVLSCLAGVKSELQ